MKPTTEQIEQTKLAESLHKDFRAACKATGTKTAHNHGWAACHTKAWFIRRAGKILAENTTVRAAEPKALWACGGPLFADDVRYIANNAPKNEITIRILKMRRWDGITAPLDCSKDKPCKACQVVRAAKPVSVRVAYTTPAGKQSETFHFHGGHSHGGKTSRYSALIPNIVNKLKAEIYIAPEILKDASYNPAKAVWEVSRQGESFWLAIALSDEPDADGWKTATTMDGRLVQVRFWRKYQA